jgi:hypothetical protein
VQAFNAVSTGAGSGPASTRSLVADAKTPAIAAAANTAAIDLNMTVPCFSFFLILKIGGAARWRCARHHKKADLVDRANALSYLEALFW